MDAPYTKRELDEKFNDLDRRLFHDDEGFLPRIERQTTKTNGRVSLLEKMLWTGMGALVMLTPWAVWITNAVLSI